MTEKSTANDFFTRYAQALMDRDAKAVAELYAVPALILFPGRSIAVTDAAQTEGFFDSAWAQYEGVTDTETDIEILAHASHSIWADVTWRHNNGTGERLVYQLLDTGAGWRIAVLTPLDQ